MNPDQLRMDRDAVQFVKDFMAGGKPVASAPPSWSSSPGRTTPCPADPAEWAQTGHLASDIRHKRERSIDARDPAP
ncbi:hypothetical protein ABZW44_41965 [Streptomyces mirabilis]|uniref:hypothetical protein n=1 Tax=Streptomyces mirabilis TaxID=68239 RepID=UPI0033B79660